MLTQIAVGIPNNEWNPTTRFPSWKNAETKTFGNIIMIEMPLLTSYNLIAIPKKEGEHEADRERKANATTHRLIIIKNKQTSKNIVRILSIVPSSEYIKNHFKTPLSFTNLSADFSGIILVRDWNENLISAIKYTNGKRHKFEPFPKQQNEEEISVYSSSNCDGTWDVVGYRQFCITVHNADEPDPCDDPSNWGSRPIIGFTVPGDCDYGGFYDPCMGMNMSDCDCLILGICSQDGNPDGDNWNEEELCLQTAETAANALANNATVSDELISIETVEESQ